MKMEAAQARKLLADAECIFDEAAVAAAVDRLAGQITEAVGEEYPLVLCVMTGGVVLAGQLLPKLRFPLDFDYLHATRYQQETRGSALSWRAAPWTSVKDRCVLVLDDILDQGITLAAVKARLLQMGARRCVCAVLADKESSERRPIEVDFAALKVPDRYVFGMGMDVYGAWRNLPAIYALVED
jgi:hypoxanthine phosphoribosyltransferase